MVFFFNDTATTEIYTLSLHDALPICRRAAPIGSRSWTRIRKDISTPGKVGRGRRGRGFRPAARVWAAGGGGDRKSTRLNSSHANISYAVFCLKKKTNATHQRALSHII